MPRLFADPAIAHGDARYPRLLRSIARAKLLILDDWGPEALTPEQARDLLEIIEDRYDKGSIIITSQVRRMLVNGARVVVRWRRKTWPWLAQLLARKPANIAIVALAHKLARIVWAVLTCGEDYRPIMVSA